MIPQRSLLAATVFMLGVSSAFAQGAATEETGKRVYDYWCATCHGTGRGKPGTNALAAKYKGTDRPAVLAERMDLTPQAVTFFVRNGISIMPIFRKTEITDVELAAIAAYLTRRRADPPVVAAPAAAARP